MRNRSSALLYLVLSDKTCFMHFTIILLENRTMWPSIYRPKKITFSVGQLARFDRALVTVYTVWICGWKTPKWGLATDIDMTLTWHRQSERSKYKISVHEMNCYKRSFRISWNESVSRRQRRQSNTLWWFLTRHRPKLQYFGYVTAGPRMNTFLEGRRGSRSQWEQRQVSWTNDITDWTLVWIKALYRQRIRLLFTVIGANGGTGT